MSSSSSPEQRGGCRRTARRSWCIVLVGDGRDASISARRRRSLGSPDQRRRRRRRVPRGRVLLPPRERRGGGGGGGSTASPVEGGRGRLSPHLVPTGLDSNLPLPRILLIHELSGTGDLLMHRKTINAGHGDPCLFRIQNSSVHNSLDFAIAQDFHVVSYVDMQCMWEWLDLFPAVAVAVNDLQAPTTCEQDV